MKITNKWITVFKEVAEDWYGNYRIADDVRYTGKYVSVGITKLSNGMYRVAVWGNDDFGMEYDTKTKNRAVLIFQRCVMEDLLTKQWLLDNGFANC